MLANYISYYCPSSIRFTMYALQNQQGHTEAFMEKNRIIAADTLQLIGILLGNCVFSCSGRLIGKYLDNVFYLLSGKKQAVGTLSPVTEPVEALLNRYQEEGEAILRSITNHSDIWIEIKGEWSKAPLNEVLQVREVVEA